jgi:4-hydroxybenzoate polyprenyltransferase
MLNCFTYQLRSVFFFGQLGLRLEHAYVFFYIHVYVVAYLILLTLYSFLIKKYLPIRDMLIGLCTNCSLT